MRGWHASTSAPCVRAEQERSRWGAERRGSCRSGDERQRADRLGVRTVAVIGCDLPSPGADATPYAPRRITTGSTGFREGAVVPLDPAIETMLGQLAAAGGPSLHDVTPAEGREMLRMLALLEGEPEPVDHVEDREIAGVPVRVYRPATEAAPPILVWYHGGGWVIGDLETTDPTVRKLANRAGALVVSVDYRLAPEHPHPAAADDAVAVLRWVADNGGALGGDPSRLAVGGDSAGGNLAAVAAVAGRDDGIALRHQLLVYPVTDATLSFPSMEENGEGYLLTKASMEWFTAHYLSGGADPKDPRVSVLRRRPHRRRARARADRGVRSAARRGRGVRGVVAGGGRRGARPPLRRHDPRLLRARHDHAGGR